MTKPSVAERFTAQKSASDILYSDFFTNLNSHPDSKQVVVSTNEAAVMRSIKNLLLTNKYERLFQPQVGSNLRNFLFEDISARTEDLITDAIRTTIENYEPRAQIIEIITTGYPEKNGYVVTVSFYLTSIDNAVTFYVPLTRVR